MNTKLKASLATVLLLLSGGILVHFYWPRDELATLETRPAVVICPNCGQSDTTWAEVSKIGGRDNRGSYVPCAKCQQTARVYNPDAVPPQAGQ